MAQNGFGPMAGHIGRIPNFGKTQVNPMGNSEPPACIQNAMMTKDKKPFTYTPGGLDLSQIRTPSMARRLARQRSQEEQEQAYAQQNYAPQTNGTYQSQGVPKPPPPPPAVPAPPPPPPLVIEVANSKSPKPPVLGERPEIVIPENPIGMLRKTNSPYHWEAEKADMQRMGSVPKFVEKVPSPLTVKMPPSSFSAQAPQYTPPSQNTNYSFNQNKPNPESPIHRPEAMYAHQKSNSPNIKTPTIELLQRQDSQFNKSPQPFANQSPIGNGSPYSPTPNNNWKQPERRDSPAYNASNSPQSPQMNRIPFTPNNQQYSQNFQNQSPPANSGSAFHTLPRVGQRNQEVNAQNNQFSAPSADSNPTPWRTNTLNRQPRETDNQNSIYNNQNSNQQQAYSPPWKANDANNNENTNTYTPPWLQTNRNQNANQQQYTPPWVNAQNTNNNGVKDNNTPWRTPDNNNNRATQSPPGKQVQQQEQPRYQSSMSIPVTPRKQNPPADYNSTPPQKEVVFVNQEPVYFCPDSPKSMPPWVKSQKEKTKTPPPAWVQRPLDTRRSAPRDLVTPPRESNQEPEWVKKSNEMQRGVRDVITPPKYQQTAQPSWSTRPSENRKSVPRDNAPSSPGNRVIPIQMDVSSTEMRDHGRQGNQAPQLRIVIGMQPNPNSQPQAAPYSQPQTGPYSQPTQRIMRVLSPQLVRLDDGQSQPELPTLSRHLTNSQENQPKTRIIPIQIEGDGANKSSRVYYHKFTQEGPPRQSKAFRVLQVITGTQDKDHIQHMENQHGFTDL